MPAKKPPEPFMIHPLAGALPEFRQNPSISVIWMLLDNRSYVSHQSLVVLAGASAFDPVVVGALRKPGRPKAPIQSVVLFTLTSETDFLSR
jgi:hypothetical protein